MQDNSRVLGSLFKSFLIKSVKGLSSGEPGEVATECKKCHGLDSFICQTFHNVAFKTYFTSSLFEHRFTVTKTPWRQDTSCEFTGLQSFTHVAVDTWHCHEGTCALKSKIKFSAMEWVSRLWEWHEENKKCTSSRFIIIEKLDNNTCNSLSCSLIHMDAHSQDCIHHGGSNIYSKLNKPCTQTT